MNMPQGHIVKAVKHACGYLGGKANLGSPVTGGGFGVGNKSVGNHNVLLIRRKPLPHMIRKHLIGTGQIADSFLGIEASDLLLRNPGQEKHLRVVKGNDSRLSLRRAGYVQTRLFQQTPAARQAIRTVVVTRNGQYRFFQVPADPLHGIIVKAYGRRRPNRAVINITGQQNGVYLPFLNNPADLVNEKVLILPKLPFSFCGTQMPVRGV